MLNFTSIIVYDSFSCVIHWSLIVGASSYGIVGPGNCSSTFMLYLASASCFLGAED